MAQMQLDARETAAHITLTVTHVGEMTWRAKIADWLIALARLISPFEIETRSNAGEPCLLYCPYCGRDFANFFIPHSDHKLALCPHCNRQCFVTVEGEEAQTVREPPLCNFGCEYVEPYGFVPEAGCPVHD